ncbi:MAG: hypothetical protein K9H26_01090 [Prolixibacteraceae bacterium]|nr:hypothetical protein [Prolixibacteraceae bacterium]
MKQNKKYRLSEKFWKGETSISEEADFFNRGKGDAVLPADELYAKFIRYARQDNAPSAGQIWEHISKRHRLRKRRLYLVSMAASFLLLVASVAFVYSSVGEDNREAEFALLEQTLKHVSEGVDPTGKSEVDIIYEDETIVIVSENSN